MDDARSPLPVITTDDPGVAAWSALLRTQAHVVRILEREVEQGSGLPLSWYDVLLELAAVPDGRLRMQSLSQRVVLSRTRISRLVDEMVVAGLVAKVPDPADGRATLATITDVGRAALHEAAPVYLAGIHEHFSQHLDDTELTTLRQALERVLGANDQSAED